MCGPSTMPNWMASLEKRMSLIEQVGNLSFPSIWTSLRDPVSRKPIDSLRQMERRSDHLWRISY